MIDVYNIIMCLFSVAISSIINSVYCKLDYEYLKSFKNIFEKIKVEDNKFKKHITDKKEEIKKDSQNEEHVL